jgi:outer membrane protein
VETGTAAPIDVTRAQAELTRRRRDLSVAKSLVRQQETFVKDYLTRSHLDSTLANAPITLTDRLALPPQDPIEPLEDLVERAMRLRPDIAQARLQIVNSEISLEGSKSALRPAVDLIATAANKGLVGSPNSYSLISTGTGNPFIPVGGAPVLTGGYGDALGQLFSRDFPDYGIGIQLTIPLRNRTARADVVRDQLTVRQQQIRLQQLAKQIRLEITNALIAVEQARQSYEAAQSERVLQEQTLAAEQDKLEVGATTTFYVIQYQRDLAAARSAEVSALTSYEKAKIALQRAVGTILDDYSVQFDEAVQGIVNSTERVRP